VTRRSRVPGRRRPRYRREIACGNDPTAALAAAVLEPPVRPGTVWDLAVRHDDECPAFQRGGSMSACTCEIVELEARRAA
jgi:hypothetical protein